MGTTHDPKTDIAVAAVRDAPVATGAAALARRLWPGRDPLGQRFRLDAQPGERTVVGVARDSKYMSLTEAPQPYLYFPLEQHYQAVVTLYVQSAGPADRLLQPVRQAVQELDRSLPLLDVSTLPTLIESSLWAQRMRAALLTLLGALALILATVGIYAVAAYSVRQRRKEIALRVALGAGRGDILRLIVRRGMLVVIAGMILGLAAVLATTRYLAAALVGIRATDPLILGGTVLLLAVVALLANGLPALPRKPRGREDCAPGGIGRARRPPCGPRRRCSKRWYWTPEPPPPGTGGLSPRVPSLRRTAPAVRCSFTNPSQQSSF
jgi:hypothetical protein